MALGQENIPVSTRAVRKRTSNERARARDGLRFPVHLIRHSHDKSENEATKPEPTPQFVPPFYIT